MRCFWLMHAVWYRLPDREHARDGFTHTHAAFVQFRARLDGLIDPNPASSALARAGGSDALPPSWRGWLDRGISSIHARVHRDYWRLDSPRPTHHASTMHSHTLDHRQALWEQPSPPRPLLLGSSCLLLLPLHWPTHCCEPRIDQQVCGTD